MVILIAASLVGCAVQPIFPVAEKELPDFIDDLDRASLNQAVDRSLAYLRRLPRERQLNLGKHTVSAGRLVDSLLVFRQLLATVRNNRALALHVSRYFDIYQAGGTGRYNPGRTMLVTGYYQPLFEGSLTRKPGYTYPLYEIPSNLVMRHLADGKREVGRLENGTFKPYWSRGEIEKQAIARGHELVWLRDPLDVFILHIQGSGLIRLEDGTIRGIHFALKNGRPYRSIGKYMVETGKMKLEEASLDTIRAYLTAHPEERDEIFHHNPSYIFFTWTDTHGAIGSLGEELTAGRSIAVDQSIFPAGALAFIRSRQPVVEEGRIVNWKPLHRFVLVQDKGSAIKGPGRVDLFWGDGREAGLAAGSMKQGGSLYFLLLKNNIVIPATLK
ncbi:murein transglycosylase A [Desulfolithobacter sp.]